MNEQITDFSELYSSYQRGLVSFPAVANLSLLRLAFLLDTEEGMKKSIEDNGVQPGMKEVMDNDYFDFILIQELFNNRSIVSIPPTLTNQLEHAEYLLKKNEEKIKEVYA